MNRHDVHLVQQIMGYPCVSITLPTRSSGATDCENVTTKGLGWPSLAKSVRAGLSTLKLTSTGLGWARHQAWP